MLDQIFKTFGDVAKPIVATVMLVALTIALIVIIGIPIALLWIALHFIRKFW